MVDLIYILLVTCMLLGATFVALIIVKKLDLPMLVRRDSANIKVLELKVDPRVGTIALVSVYQKPYLVVVAKSGLGISALCADQSDSSVQSVQSDALVSDQ